MAQDIQAQGDAPSKSADKHGDRKQGEKEQALSVYANALPRDTNQTAPSAASLPSFHLVDSTATTENRAGLLTRMALGTGDTIAAVAVGAYESGASAFHSVVNAGSAAVGSVEQAYDARAQIAGSVGARLNSTVDCAISAAEHPLHSLEQAGKVAGITLSTIGSGLETVGSAALDTAVSTGKWISNHKLETTAMVGAAAVEVLSVGTATPILAGLGAIGAAGTVFGTYSLADHLNEHAADISVLSNPAASSQQRTQSFDAIASATGGDALGLVGALTGIGAAKVLGAIKGAAPVADAVDYAKPVADAEQPAIVTATGAPSTEAATKVVTPAQPPEVQAPQRATPIDNQTPAKVARSSSADQTTEVQTRQNLASTPIENGDTVSETREPAVGDAPPLLDASGRPVSAGNAERVAMQHPPLSEAEMKAQRAAVENDLNTHNGLGGQTILEQFNNSNLSSSQKDRVLNVLAETRSSYMKTGADGQVSPEQLGSYRHTLGELKAGLESAKANGLTSAETQDALLAGMLSDSHKAGWSASTGGNFFTHHLDGALAADTILGRQIGDGFSEADLKAVQRAILEHQISPPTFMANSYTSEIRAGMKRAGVTPTAEDEQSIANIRQMMSNPMTADQEPDGMGGFRLKYTSRERELLQKYVGEGAQNWYVPARTGAEAQVKSGSLDVGKISAVVRTADIDDNYSAETDASGKAIRGPFKIAGLRGPREMPPDLSLDQATEALKNTMRSNESLLTDADKARLLSPERNAATDSVYAQAKAKVGEWLTQQLGHPPDATTPYWGQPLAAPPAGASPQDVRDWLATPDVKLGQEIQQKFAQELYEMRRTK